jgi:hypothetical protein
VRRGGRHWESGGRGGGGWVPVVPLPVASGSHWQWWQNFPLYFPLQSSRKKVAVEKIKNFVRSGGRTLCSQMDRAMELLSEAHSRELAAAARELTASKSVAEAARAEVDFLRRQLEAQRGEMEALRGEMGAQREAHGGELEALRGDMGAQREAHRGEMEALRGSLRSGIQAGVEEALRVDRERLTEATAQQHMELQYRRDQRAVWLRSQEALLRVFTIVSRMGHPSGSFSSLNRAFRGDVQLWGEIKDRCDPEEGFSYLMYSAKGGDLGRARWLIERGTNVNAACTDTGSTALMKASEKGHLGIAQLLVERGANVNAATTNYGHTALIKASGKGHLGIAQLLVERGANVNAATKGNGQTALMGACEKGHLEIVRFLLSRGASKTARNTAGKTAYALSTAHPAIRALVKP